MRLSKWLSRRGQRRIPTRWLGWDHLEDRTAPAAFTPGNLVVYRIGDGSAALTSSATAVFLDEYRTDGTFVQSVAMPTSTSGSDARFTDIAITNTGATTAAGLLSRSTDGRYLVATGYDAASGTATTFADRVIARVDPDGVIDTSTRIPTSEGYASPGRIVSAASVDGSGFWTSGGPTISSGVHYIPYGSNGGSIRLSGTITDTRAIGIFGGQLYITTAQSSTQGVFKVGSGLPTSGTSNSMAYIEPTRETPAAANPFDFIMLDRDAGVPGLDTLYIADQTAANGLLKYSFDGSSWTARGNLTGEYTGLEAAINGSSVDLYMTSRTGAGNELVKFTDSAAFNAAIASGAPTVLATAGADTVFRGLAKAPQFTSPPAPTVLQVSSPTNGTRGVGDVISIHVKFSNAVVVTGTPQITLETGTADRPVNYSTGSGTDTLVFNYTVQAGDLSSDLDYIGIAALTGGTIRDGGTDADRALPAPGDAYSLGGLNDLVVDGVVPVVTGVSSASTPGTYIVGQSILVTVGFSEPVAVAGTPQLLLQTGAANYIGGTGSSVLTFRYTVQAGDASSHLDYVNVNSLTLNGGTIQDAVNAADRTLPATGTSDLFNLGFAVDGVVPAVTGASSTTANGAYSPGAVIDITVGFSEPVFVDLGGGTPVLKLETGATDHSATYLGGSGSSTLVFRYTVQPGDSSGDLDYFNASALTLGGGTIRDAAGNNAALALASPGAAGSLGANKAIVLDSAAPFVTGVSSIAANGAYPVTSVIDITVGFSEPVLVDAAGGTPVLKLETGATDHSASYFSGSGSATLVFRYTVLPGDSASDLDYFDASALTLGGGTIRDAAGNNAVLSLAAPGADGSLGANKTIAIDGIDPTVTGVSSTTADGTYVAGQVVDVVVAFSEVVNVAGLPQITLETGITDRIADYFSGSGSKFLTFRYTIQTGDETADVDYSSTSALALNGGTIADPAGNHAALALATPGAAGSLGANKAIVVDAVVPTVSGVSSTNANGTYLFNDAIDITVSFSEPVTVTGSATLTLETGAIDRTAAFVSGSGTSTLTFRYTVQSGDASGDLDYFGAGSLAGGTIRDAAGNTAVLALAAPGAAGSLGASKNIVVDGSVPAVTGVTSVNADGLHTAGQIIDIAVSFSEPVDVTGLPLLHLETGAIDRDAVFVSGGGTNALTFRYTVTAGDSSPDLDYLGTGSLVLNGGTIRDPAGNTAVLALATPGAAGSLGASKDIVVDAVAPAIAGVTSSSPNGAYRLGDAIDIQVAFSEAVIVGGSPTLLLETGATDRTAAYLSGSGTSTLAFRYIVQVGDLSSDLDYTGTGALSGTIADAAGNAAGLLPSPGAAGSLGADKTIVVDGVAPHAISLARAAASPTSADSISYSLAFSEPISELDASDFVIAASGATFGSIALGGGGANWTVTIGAIAGDGTFRLDLLNDGSLHDTAGNPLSGGTLAGETYAIDNTAPTVVVSQAAGQPDPASVQPIAFMVVFSEPVDSFSETNITLSGSAIHGVESIAAINPSGDRMTFNVTVFDLIADGTVTVSVAAGEVPDDAGNFNLADSSSDQTVRFDASAPGAAHIAPQGNPNVNGTTARFQVAFSEPVAGVDAGNFSLVESGVSGSSVDSAVPDANPNTWLITIHVGSGDGTVRLDLSDAAGIVDASGNPLSGTRTGDEVLFVDRTAPVPTLDAVITPRNIPLSSIDIVFDEPVSAPSPSDFTLTRNGDPVSLLGAGVIDHGLGNRFTLDALDAFTTTDGDYVLTFVAGHGTATDAAGNPVLENDSVSFRVDATPPTVTLTEPATGPTNAGSLDFMVMFSERVFGLVQSNFGVSITGSIAGADVIALAPTIDPLVFIVSVNPGTGIGTVQLQLANTPALVDEAGNGVGSLPASSGFVSIDTVPAAISIDDGDPDNLVAAGAVLLYTIDVTDANPAAFDLAAADLSNAGTASIAIGTITSAPVADGLRFTVPVTAGTAGTVRLRVNVTAGFTDAAGNAALLPALGDDTIAVDAASPSVAVNSASGQPATNAQPVQFAVAFSEPVAGFTSATVVLSGTAGNVAGASKVVTNPSGDNRSFLVAVSGLTSDGTLTLVVPAEAVTDVAGNPNAASTGSNTIALDMTAPVVAGIVRSSPAAALTNAGQVVFQVNFSEPVTGVDAADFFLTTSGVSGANVASVGGGGSTWLVAVNTGTGNGTIRLNLADDDSIRDGVANPLGGGFATGDIYTVDRSPPAVSDMTRLDPAATNLASIRWRVTFNEPVQVASVNSADFTLAASGVAFTGVAVAQVNAGATDAQFIVTASGVTGNGTLRLDVTGATILDAAGNLFAAAFTGPAYTIDQTAPTVVVAQAAGQTDPAKDQPIRFAVAFSEPVGGFGKSQVALSGTAGGLAGAVVAVANPSGNLRDFEVAISGLTGDGTVMLQVPAGAATDSAGNASLAGTGTDFTVTLDATPPVVSVPDLTAASDSGTSATDNLTNDATPTFTGTAESGAFIELLAGNTVLGSTTAAGGTWTITVSALLADGLHNVKARATDAAGNSTESTALPITIDTASPTAAVVRAPGQTAAANAASPSFTAQFAIQFSESITGFDAADLAAAGTAGGSITALSIPAFIATVGNLARPGDATVHVNGGTWTDLAGNPGTASPPGQVVAVAFTTQTQVQVIPGEDATVTASVTAPAGGTPTGSVLFTLTGPGGLVNRTIPLSAGSAATTFSGLAAGNYTIAATHQPTTGYVSSNAGTTFTVSRAGGDQHEVGEYAGAAGRTVTHYNPDGTVKRTLVPFTAAEAPGGVRAVVADITGDGTPDVAAVTGPGSPALLRVFDGNTGNLIYSRPLFEGFTGGAFVAAGDLNDDDAADLAVTPDQGGGPRVTLFNGPDGAVITNFFGIDDANFRGGARSAIGDLNNDGVNDLLVSAGFGGGPRVAGYDGTTLLTTHGKLFNDFFLFETALRNGSYVSLGDLNGDGFADIMGGGGPGGAPRVLAIDGKSMVQSAAFDPIVNFFAGSTQLRGGVRVAAKDFDGDGRADLVTGSGDTGDLLAFFGYDLLAGDTSAARAVVLGGVIDGVYVG